MKSGNLTNNHLELARNYLLKEDESLLTPLVDDFLIKAGANSFMLALGISMLSKNKVEMNANLLQFLLDNSDSSTFSALVIQTNPSGKFCGVELTDELSQAVLKQKNYLDDFYYVVARLNHAKIKFDSHIAACILNAKSHIEKIDNALKSLSESSIKVTDKILDVLVNHPESAYKISSGLYYLKVSGLDNSDEVLNLVLTHPANADKIGYCAALFADNEVMVSSECMSLLLSEPGFITQITKTILMKMEDCESRSLSAVLVKDVIRQIKSDNIRFFGVESSAISQVKLDETSNHSLMQKKK